jgi:hypothetical protein
MTNNKKLYRIKMNWHGEQHEIYQHAHSPGQAEYQATMELSDLLDEHHAYVRLYFRTYPHSMLVESIRKEGMTCSTT